MTRGKPEYYSVKEFLIIYVKNLSWPSQAVKTRQIKETQKTNEASLITAAYKLAKKRLSIITTASTVS